MRSDATDRPDRPDRLSNNSFTRARMNVSLKSLSSPSSLSVGRGPAAPNTQARKQHRQTDTLRRSEIAPPDRMMGFRRLSPKLKAPSCMSLCSHVRSSGIHAAFVANCAWGTEHDESARVIPRSYEAPR
jgi:hypothetical protein